MNRRAPVRSVLAERRMFAGGGMLPISTPMQNTMDQGQPSGILASSTPLIDAVSQEVLAPITGGAMPMAQGGVAKFRTGGANDLSRQIQYALSIKPDQMYETEGGLYTPDEEVLALLQKLNPNDPLYSDVVNAARERGLSIPQPSIQLAEGPSGLSEEAGPEMPLLLSEMPLLESEKLDRALIGKTLPEKPTVSKFQPNAPDEVMLEPTPAERTPQTEKQTTTMVLEQPTVSEEIMTLSDTAPDDQSTIMQQDPEYRAAVDQAVDGIKVAIAAGPDAHRAAVAELTQSDNSEIFKQEVMERTGFVAGPDEVTEEGDFSPAPRAAGTSVEDGAVVESKYTRELTPLTSWLKTNAVTSADEIPASILSQSVDGSIDKAIAGIEGETFDKEAFKAEIESLIPTVEDDPETEGLLIAMLGASIMGGKDPNWAVNVGKGIEKALPSLINFKNKKKEAERTRQMTIAKMTIEEGLSRDREVRKAVGALEKSRTASQLSEAQRLLTPKDWWVSESITIPAELIGGKKGDPDVFLPQGSTLNLNQLSQDKLASLGVKTLPFDRGSWKLSDFISNKELMTAAEHVKAMNQYGDRVQAEVFKEFRKGGGKKINYITPTPGALTHGGRTQNMINTSDLQAFMSEYYAVKQPTIDLRNDVTEILELVLDNPSAFVGKGLLLDQTTDVVRGMFGADSAIVKELEGWGATKSLGAAEQARVKSIIVLAKIAPLLLDESGKTISDADRKMIAGTLGLNMIPNDPNDPKKGFKVELNAGIFRNPQAIVTAIQQTQQALNRRLNEVNAEARTHLATFGIPSSAKEMLEIEKEQDEQLMSEALKSLTEDLDFNLVD